MQIPTVVVVDDDPAHLLFAEMALGGSFSVSTIENSVDAARLIAELRPDIILLDLMMPRKDGLDVCLELVELAPDLVPRIVVNTANPSNPRTTSLLELGVHSIVMKHADVDEMVAFVTHVIRDQHPPRAAATAE